jgi:hypothetical protein
MSESGMRNEELGISAHPPARMKREEMGKFGIRNREFGTHLQQPCVAVAVGVASRAGAGSFLIPHSYFLIRINVVRSG